jgi:glycosyltransferase involved in cell wall biosynthesis
MENNQKRKAQPLVSILMNCYNGEKYLQEAIDSVLSQTYENWELVFWDNRSTDRSANVFESNIDSRLKYYLAPKHTNIGPARASAYKHLNGEFIAVLDCDDIWLPNKLKNQLTLFKDPDVGIVISDTLFFNDSYKKPLYDGNFPKEGYVFRDLLSKYYVSLETLIFRKETTLRLPRAFDSDFSFIADFDIVLRLSRISKLAIYPEVLSGWRMHENSYTYRFPITFAEEKERWIAKLVEEDPEILQEYGAEIQNLHKQNLKEKAVYELINKNRYRALKFILQTKLSGKKEILIFIMCLLPFSGAIIKAYLRKKNKFK